MLNQPARAAGFLPPPQAYPLRPWEKLTFEYALLLSWNYVEYFLTHSDYVRRGGRFIVPLPEPTIRP